MLKALKSLFDKIINNPPTGGENVATLKDISGSSVKIEQHNYSAQHLTVIHQHQSPSAELPDQPRNFKDKIIPNYQLQSSVESDCSNGLNVRIDEAVKLINSHQISEAKNKLFELLGEIKGGTAFPKRELVRIYNNLGVCFNRTKEEGANYEEAIKYFLLALEHDASFTKAKINLAYAYLNKGGKDEFKQSWEISNNLWNQSSFPEKEVQPLMTVLLFSIYHYKSPDEALGFVENDEKFKIEAEKYGQLQWQIASLYLEKGNYRKALDHAKKALELNSNCFQAMAFKGLSLVSIIQESAKQAYYKVTPQLENFHEVESALNVLFQAKKLFDEGCSKPLLEEVKLAIATCYLWLNKVNDKTYLEIRDELNNQLLQPGQQTLLNVIDFAAFLKRKDFDSAYRTFLNHKDFKKIAASEKERVGMMFFLEGATEQAEDLFKMIETEDYALKDCQYWLSRSAIAILHGDKHMSIQYAEKAKSLCKETKNEKKALSHYNAVMMRYAGMGEVDRLMSGVLEYDKSFPEDKALKTIKTEDESGQLSQELKDILLEQKKWFEGIRDVYLKEPIISYALERIFKRPYVEIISIGISNRDIRFISHFNLTDEQFIKECTLYFSNSDVLVLDYSSLLNLAKMGLLRNLDKMGKRYAISKRLFQKLQNELLMVESEELRFLWNYLRKNKSIEVFEYQKRDIDQSKLGDIFDDWLIESLLFSKQQKAGFISDDLRLLQFLKSHNIGVINTLTLLKDWKEKKLIDEKIYSESLGDYAERFYRFISYTGDDLFKIVMEDKGKVTWRAYFLVNEIFSPGALTKSFTTVFARFVNLIWSTGITVENKYEWLSLFADIFDKVVRRKIACNDDVKEIELVLEDFARIWGVPLRQGNKEELELIESRMSKLVLGETLSKGIIMIKAHIKRRLAELSEEHLINTQV